jgi:molybdate transport system substrate-binding protein
MHRLLTAASAVLLGAMLTNSIVADTVNGQASQPRAQLTVFTTRSIATVLDHIGGDFEQQSGVRLNIIADVAPRLVRRVNASEPFDFLVAAPPQIDELVASGRIFADTRTDLARSGIGVAVRAGAPAPDVSSVEAFTRALLNARSIAFLREGQSGVYIAGVLERLGVADRIRGKVTLPETDIVSQLVRDGEIELGIVVITQILTTAGVSLAGPLPPEIQSYITFTGGVSTKSQMPGTARELLRLLQSPAAIRVMRSQGMEPASSDGP